MKNLIETLEGLLDVAGHNFDNDYGEEFCSACHGQLSRCKKIAGDFEWINAHKDDCVYIIGKCHLTRLQSPELVEDVATLMLDESCSAGLGEPDSVEQAKAAIKAIVGGE